MSRLRADKIVNKAATAAPELTYGADVPIAGTITGAGGINITGVATASKFVGDGSGLSGVIASGTGIVCFEDGSLVGTAGTFNFGTNIACSPPSAGVATITSVNTDTNTTYSFLSQNDGNGNAILRLAGSDTSTDDTLITAGSGINFTGITAGGFSIESSLSGLANVVEDTTPQLGGNLDLNGNTINGNGGISITGGVSATIFTGAFNGASNGLSGTPDITVRNVVGASATFTGGASFGGNVSIAGTLTYEDVTNIDSVGISTFNDDTYFVGSQGPGLYKGMYWDKSLSALQFDDAVKIFMGPTADSPGWTGAGSTQAGPGATLELDGGGGTTGFINGTNDLMIRSGRYGNTSKTITIEGLVNKKNILITGGAGVKLYNNDVEKLDVNESGAVVTGILTAGTFSGVLDASELNIGSTVGIATSGGSFSANAGVPTEINSFSVSATDYKSIEYTVHLTNGNNIQAQKVLVMQNGSTAYAAEYAIMSNPNKIASITAIVSAGDCKLQATPESGISGVTTYRIIRQGIL